MVAEIIFFTALALLAILIGRRFQFLQKVTTLNPGAAKKAFSRMSEVGSTLARSVRLPARKNLENTATQQEGFWGDESVETKQELPNQYEEGDALMKAGKYQQAEQSFLRIASKYPADPKVYGRLGLLYLQQKNYSDAIESLKVAVKLDKYNPSRHYNLALAYWGNKDIQRAIMSVREAISLDPVTQKYRQLLEQLLNGK